MKYNILSGNTIKVSAIMSTTAGEFVVFTEHIASNSTYDIIRVFEAHDNNRFVILKGSCDGYHGKEEFYSYDALYSILSRYNNDILLPAV